MTFEHRYRVGKCIGMGGMAEVYQAALVGEAGFSKPVAIKRILPRYSESARFAELFINEARIASAMQHPNIVSVFEFARDEHGRLFLTMELVEGVDLGRLIKTGLLPFSVGVHIAIEILRGLEYVHELAGKDRKPLQLVHRDLSARNVLLSWEGAVKVSDFGLAKALAEESQDHSDVRGTPCYLSPEQVRGGALDRRSDLFAVGVILYELLTGTMPFHGANAIATMTEIVAGKREAPSARRSDVPRDIEAIVMQLLERDRDRRPDSAKAVIHALQQCEAVSVCARDELMELLRDRFPARDRGVPLQATQRVTVKRDAGDEAQAPEEEAGPEEAQGPGEARELEPSPECSKPRRHTETMPPVERPRRSLGRRLGVGMLAAAILAALFLVLWSRDVPTSNPDAGQPAYINAPLVMQREPVTHEPESAPEKVGSVSTPVSGARMPPRHEFRWKEF